MESEQLILREHVPSLERSLFFIHLEWCSSVHSLLKPRHTYDCVLYNQCFSIIIFGRQQPAEVVPTNKLHQSLNSCRSEMWSVWRYSLPQPSIHHFKSYCTVPVTTSRFSVKHMYFRLTHKATCILINLLDYNTHNLLIIINNDYLFH